MELFDKRFVYLEWDDILKGKKVVIGDTLGDLKEKLHSELFVSVIENKGDYPFTTSEDDVNFAMAYYDPLYEYKLAYNQGKKVEVFGFVGISRAWIEVTDDWKWEENYEYRVKPENIIIKFSKCSDCKHIDESLDAEPCHGCQIDMKIYNKASGWEHAEVKKRRWTNRELAQWVAQGNGECMGDEIAMSCWRYVYNEADMPVKDDVQIRWWNETEWHEPEIKE